MLISQLLHCHGDISACPAEGIIVNAPGPYKALRLLLISYTCAMELPPSEEGRNEERYAWHQWSAHVCCYGNSLSPQWYSFPVLPVNSVTGRHQWLEPPLSSPAVWPLAVKANRMLLVLIGVAEYSYYLIIWVSRVELNPQLLSIYTTFDLVVIATLPVTAKHTYLTL